MNEIIFYEDKNGYSELFEELIKLSVDAEHSKDARIQYNQILFCIEMLKKQGVNLPSNITKHLDGKIWELRPGVNRVLYFYCNNNVYVLLHMFRKKTQKTPKREIEKAYKEMEDYIERMEELK